MGYANQEVIYWSGQSLAEDLNGDKIEARNNSCGMFSLVWTGAAATDAVVKLQHSVDGSNWFDISGKSTTISAASGTDKWTLTAAELVAPWLRVVIVDNTESAGSLTLRFFLKGDR